ncbi:MAG: class I SAM-dependent RNA methyltransferase [Deltaproteobacteria bacterium]|nr:class I SAM-dependent RNA methyltransferase [Deltaproteobacteria bacterium]
MTPAVLNIERLAAGGDGVARLGERVVFVGATVPGDRVEVELVEETERSARGRVLRLLESSPDRVAPGCDHVEACGGCTWLHVSERAQHQAKEQLFAEALARIGGSARQALQVNPLIASPKPLRYRQRATLHLSGGRLGYRAQRSHTLVEVHACPQLDERLEAAVGKLREALATEGAPPKCTDVALACDARRVTAAFHVAASGRAVAERVERLMRRSGLEGAVIVPEGGRGEPLGKPLLSFAAPLAPGVTLHGRADLFAQANAGANELLVGEAMRMLGAPAAPGSALLELYSGAGNFTFAAARKGFAVTAIESSTDAVELARRSAREAGISTARFVLGDALKCAEAQAREGRSFEALLLDPPRAGAKGIAQLAQRCGARRVVYVSCDPGTLARDLRDLHEAGFAPREATPVDMFPQTFHLEGVVVLER